MDKDAPRGARMLGRYPNFPMEGLLNVLPTSIPIAKRENFLRSLAFGHMFGMSASGIRKVIDSYAAP